MPHSTAKRLFVALDYPDAASALAMAKTLAPLSVGFKVGLQLYYAAGVSFLEQLQELGQPLFVDLKLHDIPNTVAGAVASLVRQGVTFLNVHTQGGDEMMRAAVQAAEETARSLGHPKPVIIGVTLLTSLSKQDLRDHLFVQNVAVDEYVQHLAMRAKQCGLDGVVCSAQEASAIRKACGSDFLLVTPGIRPESEGVEMGDQARVLTPSAAILNGADYLVVGRPITQATNPYAMTEAILAEISTALDAVIPAEMGSR